jgi:hypothetical protein
MERWPWRRRRYPGRVAEARIIEELDRRTPWNEDNRDVPTRLAKRGRNRGIVD